MKPFATKNKIVISGEVTSKGKIDIEKIKDRFDLTPQGIINYLELQKPIYRQTTNYGHFGKEGLSWERIIEL